MKKLIVLVSLLAIFKLQAQESIKALVEKWQKYKRECFNDSIRKCYGLYVYGDKTYYSEGCTRIDPGNNSAYVKDTLIWSHREPDFKKFMNYLESH
jgi:hypothetical protein